VSFVECLRNIYILLRYIAAIHIGVFALGETVNILDYSDRQLKKTARRIKEKKPA
jgi:hypothetical protein